MARDGGLACARCFFRPSPAGFESCMLCARNPSPGEFLRFALVAVAFFLLIVTGRLMILGEAFGGSLRFAAADGWDPHVSFSYPIDLELFPYQVIPTGLFFGALVAIPIVTSLIFGAGFGAVLGALSFFLGPLPAASFFVTVIAAVAGASWAPTRRSVRRGLLCALLGVMALSPFLWPARVEKESMGVLAYAPLGIAAASCALLCGASISVARIRRWRAFPLIISAILSFVLVSGAFVLSVGYDVVAGRLAYESYAPGGKVLSVATIPEAVRAPAAFEVDDDAAKRRLESVFALLVYSERLKERAVEGFADIAERFKESGISPVCRYHSLTAGALVSDRSSLVEEGVLRFRRDPPGQDQLEGYAAICNEHPSSPVSALAYLELARSALHRSRFREARDLLVRLVNIFERQIPTDHVPSADLSLEDVFARFARRGRFEPEEAVMIYDYAVRRARKLLRFMEENADYDAEPLRIFCSLRPSDDAYVETIDALLASSAYMESALRDNLRLARMDATGGPRLKELLSLLEGYPGGDVTDEVLFKLAEIYRRMGPTAYNLEQEERYLSRLLVEHPESVFYPEALARSGDLRGEDAPR